jgi:hypothetical protein
MKKNLIVAGMLLLAAFALTGCDEKISGEMVTEGKVIVIGKAAVQQERVNGQMEYIDRITNLPEYKTILQDSLNKGKNVKIFWTVEKDRYVQDSTIRKIE